MPEDIERATEVARAVQIPSSREVLHVLPRGFVVDGQCKKISKSKGNAVDTNKVLTQSGAELIRLWVAAEDYREDIRLSD